MATRRRFTTEFKAKVALEAIQGELTLAQIAKKHDIHPNMIANWKRHLVREAATLFAPSRPDGDKHGDTQIKNPHAKIGQLTIEKDFLKKGLNL